MQHSKTRHHVDGASRFRGYRSASRRGIILLSGFLLGTLVACRSGNAVTPNGSEPDEEITGPVFTVSPVPVEALWRITPLGTNSKIFPIRHTYWDVCDPERVPAECPSEKLTLRAPGPGIVRNVDPAEDGRLQVTGPGGYAWGFGHVTPLVNVNDSVVAGQPVAIMHYIHGFDFETMHVTDTVTVGIANPARLRAVPLPVHPISLYPDSLRTALIRLVPNYESGDTLGRSYWDVPGTAMGAWFTAEAPDTVELFNPANAQYTLFLGRFSLRPSTRIAAIGKLWPAMQTPYLALESQAPDWETITPATGPVAIKAWAITQDGLRNLEFPQGTFLVEMTADDTLRLDWFASHEEPAGFTDSARVYVR